MGISKADSAKREGEGPGPGGGEGGEKGERNGGDGRHLCNTYGHFDCQ